MADDHTGSRNRLDLMNEDDLYLFNMALRASDHWPGQGFSVDRRGSFWFAEIYTGEFQRTNMGTQKIISSGPQGSLQEALRELIAETVKERLR